MPAGKAKGKGDLENGKEDDEDDRFSEIPAITTRRSSSMRSDVSESHLSHPTHLSCCEHDCRNVAFACLGGLPQA